ncbi:putative glutathione s-transferase [Diplodia seriata]|uniref:protein-ribulosamine 3-kinase n=1 Tax=Diplodia seriata TaxID=420778 RepID=A0A0G2GXY4_9PEZI|nr:putative glutathione s-transferase [Diplodia seriata]
MATASKPIIFYDIAHRPPVEETCCSPNPSKTRLALNFKRVPHKTTWVPMPAIASVRQQLGVPPCRQFADGSDFHTLPVVVDPSTTPPTLLGDSFDIAAHLQQTYPDAGDGNLFPCLPQPDALSFPLAPGSTAAMLVPLTPVRESAYPAYARFNVDVDSAFTAHVQLCVQGIPFDPATKEASRGDLLHSIISLPGGTIERYFLKCASEDAGRALIEGEFNAMSAIYEAAPDFVPKPHSWGEFRSKEPRTYFFLSQFIDMFSNWVPEPNQLCKKLARLHRDSVSPTGMFGFHVKTCQGRSAQHVGWDASWTACFTKILGHVMKLDANANGRWDAFDEIGRRITMRVIPRLIGALEADGRSVKPCLIHADLWEGNTGMSVETGDIYIFDAASLYAHNEMEIGD